MGNRQTEKKPIVFCGFGWGGKVMGVNRFSEQILQEMDRCLVEQNSDPDVRILIPRNVVLRQDFQRIRVVRYGRRIEQGRCMRVLTRLLWKNLIFPWYVRRVGGIGADLSLFFPAGKVGYCALHDCLRETYYTDRGDNSRFLRFYLRNAKRMIRKSDMQLITVSEFSYRELMRCYRLPKDRIEVIGNGWEHMEQIKADDTILETLGLNGGREYIFSLGSREPHKNTAWVLQAAQKNPQYVFVLTGQNIVGEQLSADVPPNVIYTGYLEDGQMKALMQHCKAFLQPSFVEGFGIPPLEALSLGKRIIVSNTSSLPEIFGDSAWYVDPYRDAVNLDELMKTPVSDGKQVLETYTWRHAAEKLLKLLSEE